MWQAAARPSIPSPSDNMEILSIQSAVTFGHVGNAAATFALQRLGCEVWPINTVEFSNHTGYGAWRGRTMDATEIAELVAGVAECGALTTCDAVLSGYLGARDQGDAVLDAVARARAANPAVLFCCDPVMGDIRQGFFVRPGIPEFFRDNAVPTADIVLPNIFEIEYLTGLPSRTLRGAVVAADALRAVGPKLVVVTGLRREDSTIAALAACAEGAWLAHCPAVRAPENGVGDLFSALFLGQYLTTHDPAESLSRAVSSVHGIMSATAMTAARELQLVAAQSAIASPKTLFKSERLR